MSTVSPYQKIMLSRKDIIINNFLGGIGWAFGATVGFSLLLAVLVLLLRKISLVPYIGSFILEITNFINKNSHLSK